MPHVHELLMLPDSPNLDTKLEAIMNPSGDAAREIIEWVAERLQLTAIHPTHDRTQ